MDTSFTRYILLCTIIPVSLFTMEIELTKIFPKHQNKNKTVQNPIVSVIDTAISTKYDDIIFSLKNFFNVAVEEKTLLGVLNTYHEYYQNDIPNNQLISALCEKNTLFHQAIQHFVTLAKTNIRNVNCFTLASIINPSYNQPIPQLNQLPLSIKQYVMQKAAECVDHIFTISFSPSSDETVTCTHLCQKICLVAAAYKEGKIRIWNYENGSLTQEWHYPTDLLCFNSKGSYLATANKDNGIITLWDPLSQNQRTSITSKKGRVEAMQFAKKSNVTILAVFHKSKSKKRNIQTLWLIKDDITHKIAKLVIPNISTLYSSSTTTFTITLKNRYYLHLCERALQNAKSIHSISCLPHTDVYKKLMKTEELYMQQKITERKRELLKKP